MEELKYPIGRFVEQPITTELLADCLGDIKFLPNQVEAAIANMNDTHLQIAYRTDGWNVQQLVHHLADSHMNAYIRTKLCFTEDNTTLKPYNEVAWANLKDVITEPINVSTTLLHSLHRRWYSFLSSLSINDMVKTCIHPDHGPKTMGWLIQIYAWHGRHHVAHIQLVRKQIGLPNY
jgi:hypothetical protein